MISRTLSWRESKVVTPATKGKFDSRIVLALTYVAIKPRKVRRCTPSFVIYPQPFIGGGGGGLTEEGGKQKETDAWKETEAVYK